ncbi:MAG: hypothetical protein LQ338_005764 [Usnochroma carphineum]|nr:MAG: hypothetical protein LQ338_005764 [Usnochroma carphineum]
MAPVLKVLIELLPSLPSTSKWSGHTTTLANQPHFNEARLQQQQHIAPNLASPSARLVDYSDLSSISWGENRLDVFRLTENNVTHKWWDGEKWNPSALKLETLGNGLATPPVALTWGVDRLDIFGLDDHNVVKHQYWDGTAWQPKVDEFENLGGGCNADYAIAASTWGEDRLDVFCVGEEGDLLHQYFDGSQWQPEAGSMESLGGNLDGDLSVVSWGKDRLDIFSVDYSGDVAHLYWDGSQWSKWETVGIPGQNYKSERLAVTSSGENRLDVFGSTGLSDLGHIYWDGSQWSSERLDDSHLMAGSAGATSWTVNRLDVVTKHRDDQSYHYKFWDGTAWRPDTLGWYNKGSSYQFASSPSVVCWGENRMDIFGISIDDELLHQAWTGYDWYPTSTDFEKLAGPEDSAGNVRSKSKSS